MRLDSLEVLTGEGQEPHRRARHDGGRPLAGQEERDLPERIARPERLWRLTVDEPQTLVPALYSAF